MQIACPLFVPRCQGVYSQLQQDGVCTQQLPLGLHLVQATQEAAEAEGWIQRNSSPLPFLPDKGGARLVFSEPACLELIRFFPAQLFRRPLCEASRSAALLRRAAVAHHKKGDIV